MVINQIFFRFKCNFLLSLSSFRCYHLRKSFLLASVSFSKWVLLWTMCADNCQTLVTQAAQAVGASEDALVDIFESMERFFQRLETYLEVLSTTFMKDMNEQIMLVVLSILATLTEEIRTGRTSELVEGTHIIHHSS